MQNKRIQIIYRVSFSFLPKGGRNEIVWINGGKYVEAKIYSQNDIISDRRLQRSKHGKNCARSSEQQDMLVLG